MHVHHALSMDVNDAQSDDWRMYQVLLAFCSIQFLVAMKSMRLHLASFKTFNSLSC